MIQVPMKKIRNKKSIRDLIPEDSRYQSEHIFFSPKYKPLFDRVEGVRYFILTGGRGSGKSFAVSTSVTDEIVNDEIFHNVLYLRQTLTSAHISIIPEFMEKVDLNGYGCHVYSTKQEVVNNSNGSKIYFRGIQSSKGSNEANLKSIPNVGTVIIDEAQELVDEDAFDRIDLSLRSKKIRNNVILSLNPTDSSHWICRRFFDERGIPEDFNGIYGDTCYIHTDWRDNRLNLSQAFIDLAEQCERSNPEKYKNIYLGFFKREKTNALWKRSTMIDPYRVKRLNVDLERIVVGVDPAVTNGEESDFTGIVVAGRAKNAHTSEYEYYVLEDRSMRGSPNEWAKEAIETYVDYDADRIIAEVNNGGDLVESIMRNIDPGISYSAVRARRGKILRAEPISALYERGLVHHVGLPSNFITLEDQMCSYVGEVGEKSPDRLDALVWALTELSGGNNAAEQGSTGGLFG